MTPHASPPTRSRPLRSILLTLVVLFALVAASCSSDEGSGNQSSSRAFSSSAVAETVDYDSAEASDYAEETALAGLDNERLTIESDVSTTGSTGGEAIAQLPDFGRDIIYTATLELASTDITLATREAIRAIESKGGFLFSQETLGGVGGSSVLTFKILPNQFQAALSDLGEIGDVRSQSISADDVTAVVVDLESRINTAEASVLRLRALLDDASELETIATLENQLLQRETTLEQLRGQLRSVRNQVDMATITVTVTELTTRPGISIHAGTYGGHEQGFGCFDSERIHSGEIGDAVTVCYKLTNEGDAPLVDIALDDQAFGTDIGSMLVVEGSAVQLAPGESVVLAQEFELSEPIRIRTAVTATALDPDGAELTEQVRATAATIRLEVTDFNAGFPSFGTVISRSWEALLSAAHLIALALVAVAPFAAVAALVGFPIRTWLRRRKAKRPVSNQDTTATSTTVKAPAPPSDWAVDAESADEANVDLDESAPNVQ